MLVATSPALGSWVSSLVHLVHSFIHSLSHSATVSTWSFGEIRSRLDISAHRDPQADLLPRRPPTGRFQAREAPPKQICCPGGFPRADLLPRSLPTCRFAVQEPPNMQVCCPGASPEAELLPERLPTGRFGARKAPTSRFGGNGWSNGRSIGWEFWEVWYSLLSFFLSISLSLSLSSLLSLIKKR